MKNRVIFGIAAALLLSGCKGSSPTEITGTDRFVDLTALTAFYAHDVSLAEATVTTLRTLDPRYTIQKVSWVFPSNPGKLYRSNPLTHARIDYAHAAGLTGAGETIAFIDEGFRTTHQEFTGKIISRPDPPHAPGVADHGTNTTSIAAGSATGGLGTLNDIIGVAPGADLQLGSFDSFEHMTAATVQAKEVRAIVQNNSWGYDIGFSDANYSRVFSSTSAIDYITSLRDLAKGSVIVFSASNDDGRKSADLMSALPVALPELEKSWITVINAVPVFQGDTIKRADLISAKCLEAAAWCMAADGTWTAATGNGDQEYEFVTGTSMAAPMVSGAVALLAEAFPTLSAQELRARLLASANNSFYKHTGYVAFAPGLKHGYNEKFGHGFLDMRAALMPIGGSFMPVSRGKSLRVDRPILQTGGMAGNVLTRRLADHDIAIVDGMGAGFDLPASILTVEAVSASGQDSALALLTGLTADPIANAFPSFVSGQQLDVAIGETRIALLMPADGSAGNFGISVMQGLGEDMPGISLGLTAMREGSSFVGMRSLLSDAPIGGTHLAAVLGLELPFSDRHGLRLTGTVGIARPEGEIPALQMSPVNFNAIGMTYGANDILASGDRITLGVNLPQVVQSGVAKVALPRTRSIGGATQFDTFDVSLAPEERQLDLSLSYALPVSRNSEVTFSAVHSLNDGHVAGRSASGAGIGFRMQF
ncbi:MAG: S8 family peptidase [Paracoccaceae bacterium]